jgi:hypothetical protein
MSVVRVYHFLPTKFALDDIEKRRLKIAEIEQLNDPFELWCIAQENHQLRRALRDYKKTMHQRFGVLCFCRAWRNPLLWSHYGDKHRGVCLGFDLPDNTIKAVTYVTERPVVQFPFTEELEVISNRLLSTKYVGWQYEEEVRSWLKLIAREPESQLYFCNFSENFQLKEVIAGPLCDISREEIAKALGDAVSGTSIV